MINSNYTKIEVLIRFRNWRCDDEWSDRLFCPFYDVKISTLNQLIQNIRTPVLRLEQIFEEKKPAAVYKNQGSYLRQFPVSGFFMPSIFSILLKDNVY